ncbi:NADH-quinone oxidoreductase subunit L [Roseivirga sp.]|uniref:NADH-quinone oxidoreductase subunit L n=1 Tax=Roseivirga sp. TaxID=1964215 RepID=UPI003B8CB80E
MINIQDLILPKGDPIIYWLIALMAIPMISFISTQSLGKRAPHWSTFLLGVNTVIAIYLTALNWNGETISIRGHWFKIGDTQITYAFLVDRLTLIMAVIVNFISLLVHLFSQEYMRKDKAKPRYFAYLGLFTFSMMGIVLFYDLLFIFIFWELVGLSSFLLIGFWFEKKSASIAANKAFIMNRIGDLGFITALMILYTQFQSFDLEVIKTLMIDSDIENGNWVTHFINNGQEFMGSLDARWLSAAGIALFCGAVGKSAQFPLQVWLPDAMEGPTPVSALIHAATMVAAGVYLLARVFVILDAQALEVVAIVGAITAFMAAIAALSQFDIKKVLAYSTISQLGYMVMAMGVGAYTAGLFHLVTHAFFKAGLFLSAGIIIHQLHKLESKEISFNTQDMRVMGGLRQHMPKTFICFLICSLALAGLPGFSGFLSKDAILLNLSVWADIKGGGFYIPEVLAFATVLLTAFYTFRMICLIFFGNFRLPKIVQKEGIGANLKEGNWVMLLPVAILALLSLSPLFGLTLNAEHTWFVEAFPTPIYLVPASYAAKSLVDVLPETFHNLHGLVNAVSIGLAFIGIIIAYFSYKPNAKLEQTFVERREPTGFLGQVSFYHWYQDAFYRKWVLKFIMLKSEALSWFDRRIIDGFVNGMAKWQVIFAHVIKWFDKYFVDGFVQLIAFTSGRVGQFTRSFHGGNVQTYIMVSFVFIILLMLYLVF